MWQFGSYKSSHIFDSAVAIPIEYEGYGAIPRYWSLPIFFFCYIFPGSGEHLAHHHEYDQHRPHEVPDLTLGTPWSPPKGIWPRICWALGLPINIAFYFTIPDVKKESCQKYVAFSFLICIVWIGVTSYILVWMVTVVGYTFMIPDTVMGLSLVAFGSSVPDCLSSLFVAQKGEAGEQFHCVNVLRSRKPRMTPNFREQKIEKESTSYTSFNSVDQVVRVLQISVTHDYKESC